MLIQKIGHCCLLIKDQGKTILTDPGLFSDGQNILTGVDVVLVTHEHQDHLHMESLKKVLANNPNAVVLSNKGVAKLLGQENIKYTLLEHGQAGKIGQLSVEGFGTEHADIYSTVPKVPNTGYLISGRFYYPGDAFFRLDKPVEILALPVAGPWMRTADAIDFALAIKPKFVFPVHDAFLKFGGPFYAMPKKLLKPAGVTFLEPQPGGVMEF